MTTCHESSGLWYGLSVGANHDPEVRKIFESKPPVQQRGPVEKLHENVFTILEFAEDVARRLSYALQLDGQPIQLEQLAIRLQAGCLEEILQEYIFCEKSEYFSPYFSSRHPGASGKKVILYEDYLGIVNQIENIIVDAMRVNQAGKGVLREGTNEETIDVMTSSSLEDGQEESVRVQTIDIIRRLVRRSLKVFTSPSTWYEVPIVPVTFELNSLVSLAKLGPRKPDSIRRVKVSGNIIEYPAHDLFMELCMLFVRGTLKADSGYSRGRQVQDLINALRAQYLHVLLQEERVYPYQSMRSGVEYVRKDTTDADADPIRLIPESLLTQIQEWIELLSSLFDGNFSDDAQRTEMVTKALALLKEQGHINDKESQKLSRIYERALAMKQEMWEELSKAFAEED